MNTKREDTPQKTNKFRSGRMDQRYHSLSYLSCTVVGLTLSSINNRVVAVHMRACSSAYWTRSHDMSAPWRHASSLRGRWDDMIHCNLIARTGGGGGGAVFMSSQSARYYPGVAILFWCPDDIIAALYGICCRNYVDSASESRFLITYYMYDSMPSH